MWKEYFTWRSQYWEIKSLKLRIYLGRRLISRPRIWLFSKTIEIAEVFLSRKISGYCLLLKHSFDIGLFMDLDVTVSEKYALEHVECDLQYR